MIFFSIIIPNYNHEEYLEDRILSILNQTYNNFEIILLDDNSNDNSKAIIHKYKNYPQVTHVLFNEINSGSPFKQWKKGIELAKGDWIWIAESDDIAEKYFLEKMMILVQKNPAVSFAYCDAYIKDEITAGNYLEVFSDIKNKKFQTDKWKYTYISPGEKELNESLKWMCTVNNVSSVLFNKKHFLETIDQIQQYRYHGDWMLYILLAQKGNIAYTSETLNTYRDHPKNHSKADNYIQNSKKECFAILNYLLQQVNITQKKELINYFTKYYVGFGLIKEKGFAKKGLFRAYRKINKALAFKVLFRLLKNRMKTI
jgi:glycosyltransferase involved in cell wall biosynthesis